MDKLQVQLQALGLGPDLPEIAGLLASGLGCDAGTAYEAINLATDLELGDLFVILPKLKLQGLPPAAECIRNLPNSPLFSTPYVDGVQLRFFFGNRKLASLLLPYIAERNTSYGRKDVLGLRDSTDPGAGKKRIVVEFSSPNIPGKFNGNHLRSTLLGQFVANIYESMGWEVVRLNYLGDWGKPYALFAVGWERFGDEEKLQQDPLGHILEVYTKIEDEFKPEMDASRQAKKDGHSTEDIESKGIFAERDEIFRKMEAGDEKTLALWQRLRDYAIGSLGTAYQRLGIEFTEYDGESQVKSETMDEIEAKLRDNGVYEESDGSWVINFDKHGVKGLGTQIIRGRTGSSTYLLRDIAAVLDRDKKYNFDEMIYVVSSRQNSHFLQVFKALELIGRADLAGKLRHESFGEIRGLTDHLHKPLLLGNILDECGDIMCGVAKKDLGDDISEHALAVMGDPTAIAGLVAQDMFGKRAQGYIFTPGRMTSLEGESGLKLQQHHLLLSSAISELRAQVEVMATELNYAALEDEGSTNLLRILAQYPDVTAATYKSLEPHALLTYLSRLADAITDILGEESDDEYEDEAGPSDAQATEDGPEVLKVKLALYESAKVVLEGGMGLLGFPVVIA
ncbi:arginyl-tRNA synthetase [Pseudomassariella vexata]|uniref:arginine--tRNA ligase n=1 Tax=Pseudomassariella vexata TaxID=1141098 RepID=A0A1Y2DH37_9PEZI|nr:arginyl-tRNA synthetase [Pseudomassariella vexata]ORY58581.1 arginyl-tRNA synthetase [Pseudomassariella vexata]